MTYATRNNGHRPIVFVLDLYVNSTRNPNLASDLRYLSSRVNSPTAAKELTTVHIVEITVRCVIDKKV